MGNNEVVTATNTRIQFDQAKVDRWLAQVTDASISEEDMESLLRMCVIESASFEVATDATLRRRLKAAFNSYCHIVRITREYEDVDVDLETSRGLVAKRKRGEPFTDQEVRLLGKRSSDREADKYLDSAFGSVVNFMSGLPLKQSAPFEVVPIECYTTLSDEQFAILAESLFEQAVVQGTGSLTDRAWFAEDASECPSLARKILIARGISLLTEGLDWALRYSKLSPEEKASHDEAVEGLLRAIHGPPAHPEERAPGAA
jgi:hypothetical protein